MTNIDYHSDVLDHGYVMLVDHWGDDSKIIESARMSTSKGFLGWGPKHETTCAGYLNPELSSFDVCGCNKTGDEKLLRYLYTHKHLSPFEMCGATFEVQAPIFVFREWHRHRTQSYNELSARYTPLPDMCYVPTVERLLLTQPGNKQAIGLDGKPLDKHFASMWQQELKECNCHIERVYKLGLEIGVPKELARLPVSVNRYSRMRASANLRNWLQFLTLRMSESAQWEIRQYANAVCQCLSQLFPRTMELFIESQKGDR